MKEKEFLTALLDHDPLEEAYQLSTAAGAPKETEDALGMLFSFAHNRVKEDMMKELTDTYYNMTWVYCEDLIRSLGFVEEYFELFFPQRPSNENHVTDFYTLWIHKELQIVLSVESYHNRVNTINANYCINQTEENKENVWRLPLTNRSPLEFFNPETQKDELVSQVKCSFDGREGLKFHLVQIKDFIEPTPWKEKPFLWFLNYEEVKTKDGDHNEISIKKLKQCKSVNRIIGWKEEEK